MHDKVEMAGYCEHEHLFAEEDFANIGRKNQSFNKQ
jgi:hypothetical protein